MNQILKIVKKVRSGSLAETYGRDIAIKMLKKKVTKIIPTYIKNTQEANPKNCKRNQLINIQKKKKLKYDSICDYKQEKY